MRRYLLIFFLLISFSFVFADTIEYSLQTSYPDTAPYYVGTQINQVKIWVENEDNDVVNIANNELDITFGNQSLKLYKKDNYFVSNTEIYITRDMLSAGKLPIKVKSMIENTTNNTNTYTVNDPSSFLKFKFNYLYTTYNRGQNVDINIKDAHTWTEKYSIDRVKKLYIKLKRTI